MDKHVTDCLQEFLLMTYEVGNNCLNDNGELETVAISALIEKLREDTGITYKQISEILIKNYNLLLPPSVIKNIEKSGNYGLQDIFRHKQI